MSVSKKQFRTVLIIELIILITIASIGVIFWTSVCGGSLTNCLDKTNAWSPFEFVAVNVLRPLSFSPIMITAIIGWESFWPYKGISSFSSICNSI